MTTTCNDLLITRLGSGTTRTDERPQPIAICAEVFKGWRGSGGVEMVTWAISRDALRPGVLVTAGDVCHMHAERAAAERCGAVMGGVPDLVQLEKHTERVWRVVWSLSDVAGGELRNPRRGGTASGGAP